MVEQQRKLGIPDELPDLTGQTGVLDWRAVTRSFGPMVNSALAVNIVGGHAVVRQVDNRVLPTAPDPLTGVVRKRLSAIH